MTQIVAAVPSLLTRNATAWPCVALGVAFRVFTFRFLARRWCCTSLLSETSFGFVRAVRVRKQPLTRGGPGGHHGDAAEGVQGHSDGRCDRHVVCEKHESRQTPLRCGGSSTRPPGGTRSATARATASKRRLSRLVFFAYHVAITPSIGMPLYAFCGVAMMSPPPLRVLTVASVSFTHRRAPSRR